MATSAPVRTTPGRTPAIALAALLVVVAAIVALGDQRAATPSSSSAPARARRDVVRGAERLFAVAGSQVAARGEADGAVPDGTTVFDSSVAGVANLDPDLLSALRQAATAAAANGIEFFIDSGWRSPRYQQRLLDGAVSKYGSREAAARWVATPNTSAHVKGEAVDIGRSNAAVWLSEHGAQYGLCRMYGNEPWHFELRPQARVHGCPAMYVDPTHDPRMTAR